MSSIKYDKEHSRFFGVKLYETKDRETIAWLEQQPSMSGYIKQLIREDMAKKSKEGKNMKTVENVTKYEDNPAMYEAAEIWVCEAIGELHQIDDYRHAAFMAETDEEKSSVLQKFENFIDCAMGDALLCHAKQVRDGKIEASEEGWEFLPDNVLSAWASEFAHTWMDGECEE